MGALTGKRLFKRDIVDETYRAITSGSIPPPSSHRIELPTSIDAMVLKALARRPSDRFPTAEAFRQELESVLHREGLRAEVVDVRGFLETHFSAERAEQDAFHVRVRKGTVDDKTPMFVQAEHGLDSGETDLPPEREPAFNDGDTERESAPDLIAMAEGLTPNYSARLLPLTEPPLHDAETLRDKTELPATPATPSTMSAAKIVLLVAVAVFVAALIGLIVGTQTR